MQSKYKLDPYIMYQPFDDNFVIKSENNQICFFKWNGDQNNNSLKKSDETYDELNSSSKDTPRINICENYETQDIKNSEEYDNTFQNDFRDEQFYKSDDTEFTNSIEKIKDMSFKVEEHFKNNDSTQDYVKFLDQLENQRTNIDIQGSAEDNEVVKSYTQDNSILKKKIEIIKTQLEDVNKEHKKLVKINNSFVTGKVDYLKKLETRKEEMVFIDEQYKRLTEEVKNNYIINYKIYNSQVKSTKNSMANKKTCFTSESDPYISTAVPQKAMIFTSNSQNIDTENIAKYYRSDKETSEFFPEINRNPMIHRSQLSKESYQKSSEDKIMQNIENLKEIHNVLSEKDKSIEQSSTKNLSFDNLTIKNSNNKMANKTATKKNTEDYHHTTPNTHNMNSYQKKFDISNSYQKKFDIMNTSELIDKSIIEKIQQSMMSKGYSDQTCDKDDVGNIINDLIKNEEMLCKDSYLTNNDALPGHLNTNSKGNNGNSSYMKRFLKQKKTPNKFITQNHLIENKENSANLVNVGYDVNKLATCKKSRENLDIFKEPVISSRSSSSNINAKARRSGSKNTGIFQQLKQKAYNSVFRNKMNNNMQKI